MNKKLFLFEKLLWKISHNRACIILVHIYTTPLQISELYSVVTYMQPSHTTSEDRYKTYVPLNVMLYCTEKQAIYV